MRNGKYLDDYNYHDWTKFMVRKAEERPKGPHFAVVLFETRIDRYPAYDLDEIHYFAFPDQETLREWILRATKAKKQFFFFEVMKLGNAEIKISVDIGV